MARTNPSPTFPSYPCGAAAVTPSDTALLASPSVLYVGGAGDVKVTTVLGDDTTFVGLSAGQIVPVQVIRVWSTGTTATYIVRVY